MTQWGLDTLFNPAKRHMDDEKNRLQSTREEVGDNSGGRRIDLESGKVVIRPRDEESDESDETGATGTTAETAAAGTAGAGKDDKAAAAPDSPEPKKGKPAPSAAAQRAAARRGRTAR